MEASERGWDGKYKDIFIRNAGDQKGGIKDKKRTNFKRARVKKKIRLKSVYL